MTTLQEQLQSRVEQYDHWAEENVTGVILCKIHS